MSDNGKMPLSTKSTMRRHTLTTLVAGLALGASLWAVAPAVANTPTGTTPQARSVATATSAEDLDRLSLEFPTVATGFASPVYVASRTGDDRLYVVERAGRIISVLPDGSERTTVLDIRTLVEDGSGEQGLLGVAFDPADTSRLFVSYTVEGTGESRVAEYAFPLASATATTPAVGTVLTVSQPGTNHNGGMIEFGPDGFLYVGMGDGGGSGDPGGHGQNPDTLLGSMLRLDVDTLPYAIPAGNPFNGVDGAEEVWAYGLRNPWRFSFDGADLWIADVGQGRREEVTVLNTATDAGANLGWNTMEGSLCYPSGNPCDAGALGMVAPRLEYGHSGGRCSITGGYVYRGTESPALEGVYIYGDFCTGEVFVATTEPGVTHTRAFPSIGSQVTSFGRGSEGEVYLVSYDGSVRHITAATFTDVGPDHPFAEQIEWVAAQGISEGYADGTFRPQSPVSRQAMAAFLYRAAGEPAFDPPTQATFSDVAVGSQFYLHVEWLVAQEIADGYDDGTFKPTNPVSRQAMAAFLYRADGDPPFTPPSEPTFSDVSASNEFYTAIEWAYAMGITQGYADGGFHPSSPVSRQAMAAFLFRWNEPA
jgi:glucose/arabinose dehydrogenase